MPDIQEKFSWSKFFSGFISPVTTAKNSQTLVWVIILILAGFTIWRAFFMPNQTMHTTIKVEKGANANITQNQTPQKKIQFFVGAFAGLENSNSTIGLVGGIIF